MKILPARRYRQDFGLLKSNKPYRRSKMILKVLETIFSTKRRKQRIPPMLFCAKNEEQGEKSKRDK